MINFLECSGGRGSAVCRGGAQSQLATAPVRGVGTVERCSSDRHSWPKCGRRPRQAQRPCSTEVPISPRVTRTPRGRRARTAGAGGSPRRYPGHDRPGSCKERQPARSSIYGRLEGGCGAGAEDELAFELEIAVGSPSPLPEAAPRTLSSTGDCPSSPNGEVPEVRLVPVRYLPALVLTLDTEHP